MPRPLLAGFCTPVRRGFFIPWSGTGFEKPDIRKQAFSRQLAVDECQLALAFGDPHRHRWLPGVFGDTSQGKDQRLTRMDDKENHEGNMS
jgi:hypothetical protein